MKKKPIVSHPAKSANEWLADIMQATYPTGRVDQVPEGWLTINQMAEITNTAVTTISHKMIRMVKAGKLQRKKFRISSGRATAEVWHYYKAEEKA
jgi:hypothetical protein